MYSIHLKKNSLLPATLIIEISLTYEDKLKIS